MDNDWKVISRVQLIRFPSMNNHLRSAEYVTITTSMSKGKDYLSYASSPLEEYEIFHVFTGGYLKCGIEKLIKVERNEHIYHRRNMIFEKIQFFPTIQYFPEDNTRNKRYYDWEAIKNCFLNCRKEE